jgi:hypothetical protein
VSKTTTSSEGPETVISTVGERGHDEKILSWRHEAFVRMGFTEFVADFLAATRIDLHQMRKLIDEGCPLDVACDILMGTMWSGDDELWRWSDERSYLEANEPPEDIALNE